MMPNGRGPVSKRSGPLRRRALIHVLPARCRCRCPARGPRSLIAPRALLLQRRSSILAFLPPTPAAALLDQLPDREKLDTGRLFGVSCCRAVLSACVFRFLFVARSGLFTILDFLALYE